MSSKRVLQDLIFIHLDSGKYSNKYWKQKIFRVSGEWECPHGVVLREDQRVPREWRPLVDDLRILPGLFVAQKNEVSEMLLHSHNPMNWVNEKMAGIDFDHVVTEDVPRKHFRYHIPEGKVPHDKKGKPMQKKIGTFEKSTAGDGPKKSSNAKGKLQKEALLQRASFWERPLRESQRKIRIQHGLLSRVHFCGMLGQPTTPTVPDDIPEAQAEILPKFLEEPIPNMTALSTPHVAGKDTSVQELAPEALTPHFSFIRKGDV
jgi:hypothetical protein